MQTKRLSTLLAIALINVAVVGAQVGGNAVYQQNYKSRDSKGEKALHQSFLSDTTLLLQARILLNQPADFYQAVFGVSIEAKTIPDCHTLMNQKLTAFIKAIEELGINREDYFIDYVSQNRVYDFERDGMILVEKLTGFEFKKNIIIRFTDIAMLDKLTSAAAQQQIFDLIKVDYLVNSSEQLQQQLFDEAMLVIKAKMERYTKTTTVKKILKSRIYSEDLNVNQPAGLYESYNAYETGAVQQAYYKSGKETVEQRKMHTFYFDAISSQAFDKVINPNPIAPCLQIVYTLNMWYETTR